MKKLIVVLAVCALPAVALAHPGGRDAYGGHYDSSTGKYHVHEGPLEGREYQSQENMLKVLHQTKGGPAIIKRAESGNAPAQKPAQSHLKPATQKATTQKQATQKKDESEESIAEILLREIFKARDKK